MADVTPVTTMHVALTEKEYHLVMLALARIASHDTIKVEGRQREHAASLNQQLLQIERSVLGQRIETLDKKIANAPPIPELDQANDQS